MAEPVQLHDLMVHILFRVLTGVFSAVATIIVAASAIETPGEPVRWVVFGLFVLFFFVIYRIGWRTRLVYADGDVLLVGRGANQRRIPISEVVSVDRPMWANSDFSAPYEIVLRDGPSVTFFPVAGAPDYITSRRAARSP